MIGLNTAMVKELSISESSTGRRGIQSVEIGLRVIEALRGAIGPLSLKALSAAADLPISNCHRYCVSFVRSGYMLQDATTGRYDLGPRLIQAGLVALARSDAIAVATEELEALVDETGNTGQLAIWGDRGPTIIRWITGRLAVRTSMTLGTTLPLLTSATGRIFLAFLPQRQTAALASYEAMAGGGDPQALAAQAQVMGIGQVTGDHIPGLSAVAAPVLDAYGEATAVITLIGVQGGIAPHAAEQLRQAAVRASIRLGWQLSETQRTV